MKSFWIKLANLAAIAGVLCGYHLTVLVRDGKEEAARLSAELAQANARYHTGQMAFAADGGELKVVGGQYLDGTYTGEAEGFGGLLSLELTVSEGKIKDITILSAEGEDPAYLSMAEGMIPAILEKQSADVDTVSGATFSSTGIKNAAEQALRKAGK